MCGTYIATYLLKPLARENAATSSCWPYLLARETIDRDVVCLCRDVIIAGLLMSHSLRLRAGIRPRCIRVYTATAEASTLPISDGKYCFSIDPLFCIFNFIH